MPKQKTDYTGQIFGNLKVVGNHSRKKWDCICTVCGRESTKDIRTLQQIREKDQIGCLFCQYDITGQKYGNIRVIGMTENKTEHGTPLWECVCEECGDKTERTKSSLNRTKNKGKTGCRICDAPKIIGQRFGKLVALEEVEPRIHIVSTTGEVQKKRYYLCQCDCGNIATVFGTDLTSGHTKSCGCYAAECTSKRLLGSGQRRGQFLDSKYDRLFTSWGCMLQRCNNPKNNRYQYYGAKGVTVCPEWYEFNNFAEWSIVHGYAPDLSIDRIDVNGNYEPSNCKWSTILEQSNNKTSCRMLTMNGETHTLKDWSRITGIPDSTIRHRIDIGHYSVADALSMKEDGRFTVHKQMLSKLAESTTPVLASTT